MELRAWFFPSQNSFSVRRLLFSIFMGYSDGSVGKESAYNAGDTGDMGSISGSRRSPGEGNGNPLQYSCLKKFHVQSSLEGYSPWACKELDVTEAT